MLSQMQAPSHVHVQDRPFEDLICSYADWDCQKAYRVMWCESRGNQNASSAGNLGLFQINQIHRGRVGGDANALFDPEANVAVAHAIWSEQGWAPWGCRNA